MTRYTGGSDGSPSGRADHHCHRGGTSILLQARGTGLSSTFGGESTAYRSRRGLERTLFRLTVVLIAVFVIISLIGARQTSVG